MKFCLLTDSLYGKDSEYIPGGQPIVDGLNKALVKKGFSVDILTTRNKYDIGLKKYDVILSLSPRINFPTKALKIIVIHDIYPKIDYRTVDADIFLTSGPLMKSKLSLYKPTYLWHFAADTEVFRPVEPNPEYAHDFVYLGNGKWKDEEEVKRYLGLFDDLDIGLYGFGWEGPHAHGILPVGKEAELYSSAKVVLNFTKKEQKYEGMVNNRVHESLSCGALLLTDYVPGIQRMFGDCCLVRENWGELDLPSLINLNDAEILKKRAREKILKYHTWDNRIEEILNIINSKV